MYDKLFEALAKSEFRSRFKLNLKDKTYIEQKGIETIREHARQFVEARLADSEPPNDGKQTPTHGHPVFKAQHATATCCRKCLDKWHKIPKFLPLNEEQKQYVVDVIMEWINRQLSQQKEN